MVFVRTDAAPAALVDTIAAGITYLPKTSRQELFRELCNHDQATARELTAAMDDNRSKRTVLDALNKFEDNGFVERSKAAGEHGADVFTPVTTRAANVDLGLESLPGHAPANATPHRSQQDPEPTEAILVTPVT